MPVDRPVSSTPTRKMPVALPDIGPGRLVGGTYKVIDQLGAGAMGRVWKAEDTTLGRPVALKTVLPQHDESEAIQDQFLEEARAMAKVKHPNVVEIYSFGTVGATPYFAMEFIEGPTLRDWMDKREGLLSIDEVVGVFEQLCRGVDAMHQVGAVHRDLKPANVLIGPGFRVAIADLGLAQFRAKQGPFKLSGTPGFIAPETILCEPVSPALASRADIYALGAILYELLTGVEPLEIDDPMELLRVQVERDPPPPSDHRPELSSAFDAILAGALARDPAARTPSALELRRALIDARTQQAAADDRPLRIVAVDDDPDFLDILEAHLENAFPRAKIDKFCNGRNALSAMQGASLVILDLQMPGLTGMDLTSELRRNRATADIPILVLTATGTGQDWAELRALGADAFQLKPLDHDALVASARRLLGS